MKLKTLQQSHSLKGQLEQVIFHDILLLYIEMYSKADFSYWELLLFQIKFQHCIDSDVNELNWNFPLFLSGQHIILFHGILIQTPSISLRLRLNKTCTHRFQDCCKNWILSLGFCFYGCKKLINFKSLKVNSCVKEKWKREHNLEKGCLG